MSERVHGIWRWLTISAGLGFSGAAFALVVPLAVTHSGSAAPALLLSERPLMAIAATLGALAVATLVAAIVGRLTNAAVGLFVLGSGLAVLSMRGGTIQDMAFDGSGSMRVLALETAAWAGLLLIAGLVVFAVAGPLPDLDPTDDDGRPVGWYSFDAVVGAAFGAVVIAAVIVIARSPMKGQALAAALMGAMVAGLLARAIKPHARPVLLFVTPCAAGAVGHLIASSMLGTTPLDIALIKGSMPALAKVMPVDYAAGALTGVSLGLGWARSFGHQPEHAAPGAAVQSG